MKKLWFILFATFCILSFFGCDDENTPYTENESKKIMAPLPSLEEYMNGGMPPEKLEQVKIPDSINTSLIIAIYDEELPQAGRTILVYTDSLRASANKISYLKDSTVKAEPLQKIRYDEFKSKFTNETYVVSPTHVHWQYETGVSATDYEYARLDNFR